MSDETAIAMPEAPAEPLDLGSAVHASEGLHDDAPETSAPPSDVAPEPQGERPASIDDGTRERVISEWRQQEEARANAEAERQKALEAWERDRQLARLAADGDLNAQEEIYQKGLRELQEREERQRMEEALAPERAKMADFVRRSVWEEMARAAGVDPNDRDLLSVSSDAGFRGLTRALLAKATDKELLEAVRHNPVVKSWVDSELATARDAAQARGMARALGSGDAPRLDASPGAGSRAMSGPELERALLRDPQNPDLYRAWVDAERRAGRYW